MKPGAFLLLTFLGGLGALSAVAQTNISEWSSEKKDPIVVERLAGDSLTTSFLIEIKESVPRHYHAFHSEHVYILAGECRLSLGETEMTLAPGDYVFIPMKTPHEVTVIGSKPLRVLSIQSPEFHGEDRIKAP